MDTFYFEKLPLDVQSIVLGIETRIKREIKVEVQTSERDVLACNVEGLHPKIIIPRDDFFPESSVLHELLHIERFLVACTPSLTVSESHWSAIAQQAFCGIDNDLEHLVIVPREIKIRPLRVKYWKSKFDEALRKIEALPISTIDRARFSMQLWINVNVAIDDSELQSRCFCVIKSEGVIQQAQKFLLDVQESKFCKKRLSYIYVEHLDLDRHNPCLEFFCDCHKGNQIPI